MSDQIQSRLPDADMQSAPRALLRAAKRAREVARRTGTAVVVIRDGVVVEDAVTESDEVREGSAAPR